MALLDDIGEQLQNTGVGTLGTDIFLGRMPDAPDDCIAVFEYAGNSPTLMHGSYIERPGVQVKVRSTDYQTGIEKIWEVIESLHMVRNAYIGSTKYIFISANQSPTPLGIDSAGRQQFVVNFSVLR